MKTGKDWMFELYERDKTVIMWDEVEEIQRDAWESACELLKTNLAMTVSEGGTLTTRDIRVYPIPFPIPPRRMQP
jgi:hypothetical protein